MSSLSRNCAWLLILVLQFSAWAEAHDLRVCADPHNMPFSNVQRQGFENRIAELLAANLGAHLIYVWQRMGRGFVREYLNDAKCDLLIGIPNTYRPLLTTAPYYRSSYVFVSRRNHLPPITSFNSPRLRGLRVGVQVLDEDYTPPAEALARRGLQGEIRGFDTTGDDADSIIQAVVKRTVDIAIVWGPLAGYFARQHRDLLAITPVEPEVDPPGLPFTFSISMGVRKGNIGLHEKLNTFLVNHRKQIRSILDEYGVPQLPLAADGAQMTTGD